MTPIVTRELVRRYLVATGQITDELRAFDKLPNLTPGDTYDEGLEWFLDMHSSIDRAVLGMLAAAEMLLDAPPGTAVGRYAAERYIAMLTMAGVDPEAWEKARGR